MTDVEDAITAMAAGGAHGQFWTSDEIDIFLSCYADHTQHALRLSWSLNSVFTIRRPTPEAHTYRALHSRLTALWLDFAKRLNADIGRVLDEWSYDQVWHLPHVQEEFHPGGGWPALLGWWTYLGPERCRHLPPAPLAEIGEKALPLANGGLLVSLLDDPTTVDPIRYEEIHTRWLQESSHTT
ncbi:MAG TPA: hypothetical protein VFX61_23610 [Micromonosporaceae bacterium]|nr:hypothetical protein [Micromonosporaceae bacterium]